MNTRDAFIRREKVDTKRPKYSETLDHLGNLVLSYASMIEKDPDYYEDERLRQALNKLDQAFVNLRSAYWSMIGMFSYEDFADNDPARTGRL